MIGQSLAHYRIDSKLGAGGMGVVYLAHDTHLDRSVAIKVLPPERTGDPDRKRRFVREAKAASALSHPNIITIHDIDACVPSGSDHAASVEFIVMEYIDGRSLDQRISKGPLESEEVQAYAVQIAAALAAQPSTAHCLHLDYSPTHKPGDLRSQPGAPGVVTGLVGSLIFASRARLACSLTKDGDCRSRVVDRLVGRRCDEDSLLDGGKLPIDAQAFFSDFLRSLG